MISLAIERQPFTFDMFCRIKKARCKELHELLADCPIANHPDLKPMFEAVWADVEPIGFEEGLQEKDLTRKRIMFGHIGPAKAFNKVRKKVKVDTYKHSNKQGDTYNLWKIKPSELGLTLQNDIFAVQCWCPSTNNEYWIYVDHREERCTRSAKEAIAWTCVCDVSNVEEIYRQGEVYLFKWGESSKKVEPYHMMGDEYFNKLVLQT